MTYGKTRTDIYRDLVALAGTIGVDETKMETLLAYPADTDALNSGNAVTDDLKWHVKYGRYNAIHVSPTVLVNGIMDNKISSSWAPEQWSEHLQKAIAATLPAKV